MNRLRLNRVGTALLAALSSAFLLAALGGDPPSARAGAVSSAQAIAWLNAQRAANGIPAGITDDPEWDLGCRLHMAWWKQNPDASNPHIETPGTPGYTAEGAFAGANAVLDEFSDWEASSRYPWRAADPWETAPIHLMQLLGAELSVTGFSPTCMITWAGYQRPAPPSPELLTYPGNGTSFVYSSEQADEWPFTPAQFVGLTAGGTTGPYLYVLGWGTGRGKLTAASLSGPRGPLEVRTVDNSTTGTLGELGSYLPPGGMLIPVKPLTPGASYTASATFAPAASQPSILTITGPPSASNPIVLSEGPGSEAPPPAVPAPITVSWTFKTAPLPKPRGHARHSGRRR